MLALSGMSWIEPVRAQNPQKHVLVLYSVRRDAQIAVIGDRELPRIFNEGLEPAVDYHSEYIDTGRFPNQEYDEAFRQFLLLKYKHQKFDVIVAISRPAVEFIDRHRSELFADTPVVFFENDFKDRIDNSTGIIGEPDVGGTVDLARTLQPDLQRVFVVVGADAIDGDYERVARRQLRSFESRLAVTYLSGLTTSDLETELAALPAHSAVIFLIVNRDGAGQLFHPLGYLDRTVSVANAPTYCWVESSIGHGVVGGRLRSQGAEMTAIGRLALRVLRGEPADTIPLSYVNLNVPQVDWRQLQRWGISEERIPDGTLIRFREDTVWDRYQKYILGASGSCSPSQD